LGGAGEFGYQRDEYVARQTHLAMHLDEDHMLPRRKAKCFDVFVERVLLKDLSHGERYNIWMVRYD
jgi:hypothetical protein